jgi:DNA primase
MDNNSTPAPEFIDLNHPEGGLMLNEFTTAEKLQAMTARYEEVQAQHAQAHGLHLNTQTALRRLTDNVDHFEQALKNAIEEESIDSDLAAEFADIFDIQLEKNYEFTVTVEYTFSVTAPMSTDPDSIVESLNFNVESGYYSDGIEINDEDANVTHSDYTEV